MKLPRQESAQSYQRAAFMHLEAAELLLKDCSKHTGSTLAAEVVYLSGYVAECALKSMLLTRTPLAKRKVLLENLRNPKLLGHDLEALHEELDLRGVQLRTSLVTDLQLVRRYWNPQMRYSALRYTREVAEKIFDAASRLLRWTTRG